MKTKKMVLLFSAIVSLMPFFPLSLLQAQTSIHPNFAKRFAIERNQQGQVVSVRAKKFYQQIGIGPFLQVIFQAIAQLPKTKPNSDTTGKVAPVTTTEELQFQALVKETLATFAGRVSTTGGSTFADQPAADELKAIQSGIEYFSKNGEQKFEWGKAIQQAQQDQELKQAESALTKLAVDLRPDILAKPQDPTHYFRQYVLVQASQLILQLVIKKLPSIPYLGVVRTVLQELTSAFEDQRTYQQYMLMSYLTALKPEQMGLSQMEVDHILSSIAADHLKIQAALQLRQLQEQWDSFGRKRYNQQLLATTNEVRLGKEAQVYLESSKVLNWIYGEVQMELPKKESATSTIPSTTAGWGAGVSGQQQTRRIYNFALRANLFSKQPSLVWDELRPNHVKVVRLLIKLAEMGVDALPIPGIIKSGAHQLAASTYAGQRLMEGALVGHAELYQLPGWQRMKGILKEQSLHPYLYQE